MIDDHIPDCKLCMQSRTGTCTTHIVADIVDVDQLWHIVNLWISNNTDGATRDKMRRMLIRRLRHPEMGGVGSNPPDVVTKREPGPRQFPIHPAPCVCADTGYVLFNHPHDELTGECLVCECKRYEPIPETAGSHHQIVIGGDHWRELL